MSSFDAEVVCPRCKGGSRQGYQDCAQCDGSGYVCPCLHCEVEIPAPEAEEHGQYCAFCRDFLDMSDEEVAAREAREAAE